VEVGFASFGDIERDLEEDLKLLIEAGCAVIVCATHPRLTVTFRLVERLASEAQPPFEVVWIEKDRDTDHHESGNRKAANEIIVVVRKAIQPTSASPLPQSDSSHHLAVTSSPPIT